MLERMLTIAKYVWASPGTWLGLVAAALTLASGGSVRVVAGALEVHGGFATWLLRHGMPWMPYGAAAMTLGHVILGSDADSLDHSRRHEHVHVRQYERWGPLFLPLYVFYSVTIWLRGGDGYRENPLEVEAYDADAQR